MRQELIFSPLAALVELTFVVSVMLVRARFRAGKLRQVTAADFRLGESERVPPHVAVINRNYMNLLQAPVLFYAVCLAFHAVGEVDRTVLALAWAYVAFRVAHTVVHLTSNNVMHRLAAFALSMAVLAAMWVWLGGGRKSVV